MDSRLASFLIVLCKAVIKNLIKGDKIFIRDLTFECKI